MRAIALAIFALTIPLSAAKPMDESDSTVLGLVVMAFMICPFMGW